MPFPQFPAVLSEDTKRLDGIHVVERLHLESHHLAAHLTHFLAVFPLLFDDIARYDEHKRCTGKGQQGHDGVVVHDNGQRGEELVDGDDDGRQPTDGIAAHSSHVTRKPVEHVAVAVLVDGHPVGIDDLVEDITLYIVVDVDLQFQCDTPQDIANHQTEQCAAHHDNHHDPQFRHLIARDDVYHVFPGNAAYQSQCGADDA